MFRFPGATDRTAILGASGSGKTTGGLWFLAHQRLERRPWIAIDFKLEEAFDWIGFPPIERIGIADPIPKKPGLYLLSPLPGQERQLDAFLWRVWRKGNCGLYIDEATLMPNPSEPFQAILRQGRSMRIPVIACSQRPVDVPREVFSEANFFAIYRLNDRRDYKVVEGFVPNTVSLDLASPMPRHWWRWYDTENVELIEFRPVPHKRAVVEMLRERLPRRTTWHPWGWAGQPSGRPRIPLQ